MWSVTKQEEALYITKRTPKFKPKNDVFFKEKHMSEKKKNVFR